MIEKVVIMGAAGRDFHNFNVYFRGNPRYRVLAFTAGQIEGLGRRRYPPELAGPDYPEGVPIYPEDEVARLIRENAVDLAVFSYSDISHVELMHRASAVMAAGADFMMIGASYSMLASKRPVIAVCAVRTGCGKSPVTRKVCEVLRRMGKTVVVVRHPMPYGNLALQETQRFENAADFDRHQCTIEEREEYEPLVERGLVVMAGVDYAKVLRRAEAEAEVIVWDGGNNDTPFFKPDLHLTVFDALRPDHERLYHPGETNMLLADLAIIAKADAAPDANLARIRQNIAAANPRATVIVSGMPVRVDDPEAVRGRRVLAVEDGPTLTHGGMPHGAGVAAARKYGAAHIVDPRPFAQGGLVEVFEKYPHIGPALPAMGYSPAQIADLEKTIEATDCDVVLLATPARLSRVLTLGKPSVTVSYEYADLGEPDLESVLREKLAGIV